MKEMVKKIKKTAFAMLSPYITFLLIAILLIGGLFMGVEELWEEFTSKMGIKEVNSSSKGFSWPLPGYSDISSDFGERIHPIKKTSSFHDGIDLPAPEGTDIVSPTNGTVTNVYNSQTLGNTVEIESGDYKFVFHHMISVNVQKDDNVQKGEVIGGVGSTGTLSTGNHLHFTVYEKGKLINPLNIINFNDNYNEDEEKIENITTNSISNQIVNNVLNEGS